jgi:[ribosomal protein S18]-alanine N-acetyltransferase
MELERTLAPKSWKIRSFQPDDVETLDTLAEISLSSPAASQFSAEDYRRIAYMEGGTLLLCERDGQICALLAGRQAGGEAEILNFAVHPRVRRLGIAADLLSAALQKFTDKGIANVFLEVRETNAPAIALYDKFGFSIAHRRKAYYRDPVEDGLCLMRKLTGPES